MLWEGGKSKQFSVKSYYHILSNSNSALFPWNAIWKTKAPGRVAFFVWEANNGANLTGDNLRLQHKVYVSWCFMCKGNEESVNTSYSTVQWQGSYGISCLIYLISRG